VKRTNLADKLNLDAKVLVLLALRNGDDDGAGDGLLAREEGQGHRLVLLIHHGDGIMLTVKLNVDLRTRAEAEKTLQTQRGNMQQQHKGEDVVRNKKSDVNGKYPSLVSAPRLYGGCTGAETKRKTVNTIHRYLRTAIFK